MFVNSSARYAILTLTVISSLLLLCCTFSHLEYGRYTWRLWGSWMLIHASKSHSHKKGRIELFIPSYLTPEPEFFIGLLHGFLSGRILFSSGMWQEQGGFLFQKLQDFWAQHQDECSEGQARVRQIVCTTKWMGWWGLGLENKIGTWLTELRCTW